MQIPRIAVAIVQVISAQVAAQEVLVLVEVVEASVTVSAVGTVTAMVSTVEVVDLVVVMVVTVVLAVAVTEEDLVADVVEALELAHVVQECGNQIELRV